MYDTPEDDCARRKAALNYPCELGRDCYCHHFFKATGQMEPNKKRRLFNFMQKVRNSARS